MTQTDTRLTTTAAVSRIETAPPPGGGPAALRRAVYGGTIFKLPPTPASLRLVVDVMSLVEQEFGHDGPAREAQFRRSGEEFFRGVGRLRKLLYEGGRFLAAMRAVVAPFGFPPAETAFDPLRLRVAAHRGHENPKAAAVYYAHRDTWYSHPQSLVNWWVPLHDLGEDETFVFFPDYFTRPAANNSGDFDYDTWAQNRAGLRVGWQDPNAGTTALYPGCAADLSQARRLGFSCRAGEMLVFSGAHLHQTIGQTTGRARFSIDFRTVHLGDHAAGVAAPNVDNRSTGSALPDYLHPSTGGGA